MTKLLVNCQFPLLKRTLKQLFEPQTKKTKLIKTLNGQ